MIVARVDDDSDGADLRKGAREQVVACEHHDAFAGELCAKPARIAVLQLDAERPSAAREILRRLAAARCETPLLLRCGLHHHRALQELPLYAAAYPHVRDSFREHDDLTHRIAKDSFEQPHTATIPVLARVAPHLKRLPPDAVTAFVGSLAAGERRVSASWLSARLGRSAKWLRDSAKLAGMPAYDARMGTILIAHCVWWREKLGFDWKGAAGRAGYDDVRALEERAHRLFKMSLNAMLRGGAFEVVLQRIEEWLRRSNPAG